MFTLEVSDGTGKVAKVAGVRPMRRLRLQSSVRTSWSAILWLLLTASFYMQELVAGILAAGALAYGHRSSIVACVRWSFALPSTILIYLGIFAAALFRSNIDVARRIVSSTLPIRPAQTSRN
jgi:multisubunit Na+/H+ antiporter MnhE subunit